MYRTPRSTPETHAAAENTVSNFVSNGSCLNGRRMRLALVAQVVCACATAPSLYAQGEFIGNWTIAEWKVAPWVPRAERASIKPNTAMLNRTVTISTKGVAGPKVLACANAKYVIVSSPLEGLFEGGLKQPNTDGAAFGFNAPVKTLRPNCDLDFHMRNRNSVLFAVDNVVYTMTRKAPAPKLGRSF